MEHHLDFSSGLKVAWFLPSLHPAFVQTVSKDLYDLRGEHRPKSFFSTSQLNFLDPVHSFFFYPCALYSAGLAELDVERGKKSEAIIHDRDRSNTTLIADSGGFQIIEDKLAIDWDAPDPTLLKILRWMEAVADAGMTIDVPLRAIETNPRFPTFDACLKQTLYNLELFERNQAGTLALINCLHGRTEQEADTWYDAVKRYRFAGWAFGGVLGNNLYLTLRQIVKMRDEGRLNDIRWVHFFGHGTGHAGLIFSTLHICLTKLVNRNIQVTYDASNPFLKSRYTTIDLYHTNHVGKNPSRLTYERFDNFSEIQPPRQALPGCVVAGDAQHRRRRHPQPEAECARQPGFALARDHPGPQHLREHQGDRGRRLCHVTGNVLSGDRRRSRPRLPPRRSGSVRLSKMC